MHIQLLGFKISDLKGIGNKAFPQKTREVQIYILTDFMYFKYLKCWLHMGYSKMDQNLCRNIIIELHMS